MSENTQKQISVERVAELIEAYGSNAQCWPELERVAAKARLEASPHLQQLLQEAEQLDDLLEAGRAEEPLDEVLLARIVNNLPAQPATPKATGVKLAWLHNVPAAMAAGIAVVAIMFVALNVPLQVIPHEQIALQDIDYFLWQDVTDQVSFDSAEEPPTDFMSII
jgi:hypothetical protein